MKISANLAKILIRHVLSTVDAARYTNCYVCTYVWRHARVGKALTDIFAYTSDKITLAADVKLVQILGAVLASS